jgi:hypothetical protein
LTAAGPQASAHQVGNERWAKAHPT